MGLRLVELTRGLGFFSSGVTKQLLELGQQARVLLRELLFVPLDLAFLGLFHVSEVLRLGICFDLCGFY